MSFNTLPTDSLFRSNTPLTAPMSVNTAELAPIPSATRDHTPGSFNKPVTPSTTTTTGTSANATTIAVSLTFVPVTSNVPATPGIEQPAGSFPTIPPKTDLSSIPPAFFAGPKERENPIVFESQSSTDSGSFGYGDRRLSTVLAQDKEEEKEEEKAAEVTVKKVILTAADASRGIFGDKRLKSASDSFVGAAAIEVSNSNSSNNNALETTAQELNMPEPPKTIRVFGYPVHLTHDVLQYFMTYGKIEEYKETLGRWMTIRYESSACALAALNGNGAFISKDYMIGVVLEPQENSTATTEVRKLEPIKDSDSLYKNLKKNKSSLGSGKVGISASDKNNANDSDANKNFANVGIMTKLKDYLLSW